MNFRELDLNLLLVFNAIFSERSISKAARKLGMSQPAVSNALRRLRDFTGDTLFYKSGTGVAPTRAALTLAIPISHALDTVERSLTSVRSFDPETSHRTFKIGVTDVTNQLLTPALVSLTRRIAPNIQLEFVTQPGTGSPEALKRGEFDIGFLSTFALDNELISEVVWDEPFALIVSRNNPKARNPTPSIKDVNEMDFVMTSHMPALRNAIDNVFRQNGIERKVVCMVADTQSLYPLVSMSDLAACVGRTMAEHYNQDDSLVFLDLPFNLGRAEANVVWTASSDDDDGHRWLREHVIEILRSAFRLHARVDQTAA